MGAIAHYLPSDHILEAAMFHGYWQVSAFICSAKLCVWQVGSHLVGTCAYKQVWAPLQGLQWSGQEAFSDQQCGQDCSFASPLVVQRDCLQEVVSLGPHA